MDKFIDINDQSKSNQESINHLNRCITRNKIEATKSLTPNKVQDLMDHY
jgi:hypothetical protein